MAKQITFRFKKRARIYTSMFAGLCFIALAVWGWDLPIETVIVFTLICFGFLIIIVLLAACAGWLLATIKKHFGKHHDIDDK